MYIHVCICMYVHIYQIAEKLLIKAEEEKLILKEAAVVAEKALLKEMQTKEKVFRQNQLTAKNMEEEYKVLLDARYEGTHL